MNIVSNRLVAVGFAAGLATVSLAAAAADAPTAQGVLGLTATASVEVARDLISITFSTSREGSDANAVQAQLKQALDGALAEAKRAARPGQIDVQTGNFSLYPRYSPKGGISGWQGSAEVVVEGRDMSGIGQLAGRISTMTIARVGYRLSREASDKVEADVAGEAIARYRAKAQSYAKQFGYAGYAIREVNVSSSEPPPGPMPMMRMTSPTSLSKSSDALSVEPGQAVVTATVNGTVQMK